MCRFSKLLLFSFFFCKDGSDRLMKRASYSCCNFLCIVLAAAYLKYRLCRLSCLPFVWHPFFIVTHTHTHVIDWWDGPLAVVFFFFFALYLPTCEVSLVTLVMLAIHLALFFHCDTHTHTHTRARARAHTQAHTNNLLCMAEPFAALGSAILVLPEWPGNRKASLRIEPPGSVTWLCWLAAKWAPLQGHTARDERHQCKGTLQKTLMQGHTAKDRKHQCKGTLQKTPMQGHTEKDRKHQCKGILKKTGNTNARAHCKRHQCKGILKKTGNTNARAHCKRHQCKGILKKTGNTNARAYWKRQETPMQGHTAKDKDTNARAHCQQRTEDDRTDNLQPRLIYRHNSQNSMYMQTHTFRHRMCTDKCEGQHNWDCVKATQSLGRVQWVVHGLGSLSSDKRGTISPSKNVSSTHYHWSHNCKCEASGLGINGVQCSSMPQIQHCTD